MTIELNTGNRRHFPCIMFRDQIECIGWNIKNQFQNIGRFVMCLFNLRIYSKRTIIILCSGYFKFSSSFIRILFGNFSIFQRIRILSFENSSLALIHHEKLYVKEQHFDAFIQCIRSMQLNFNTMPLCVWIKSIRPMQTQRKTFIWKVQSFSFSVTCVHRIRMNNWAMCCCLFSQFRKIFQCLLRVLFDVVWEISA